MSPRLVPLSVMEAAVRVEATVRVKNRGRTPGPPIRQKTQKPQKQRAKRRPTAYVNFCQQFLAEGGGKGRLQSAAAAWNKMSLDQKLAYAPARGPDLSSPQTEVAAASRGGELGGTSPVPVKATDGPGAATVAAPRHGWPAVRFGGFAVVSGRAPLGRGGYGQALEVVDGSGVSRALKLFEEPEEMEAEAAAYNAIEGTVRAEQAKGVFSPAHGMFLQMLTQSAVPPLAWMVLPLVPGENLWEQLRARRLSRSEAASIIWNAWIALKFLHRGVGMLHLDVKPNNMMWHKERFVLLDFSLWERWPVPADRRVRSVYCTDGFRPPEVSAMRRLSQMERRVVLCPAVDWWSLGCAAACLAWAASEDPPLRTKIFLRAWDDALVRNRDLETVAPSGCPLRPVLDMLLHMCPDERGTMPLAFARMLAQEGDSREQ